MRDWIKRHWLEVIGFVATGMLGFVGGQLFPAYAHYIEAQRTDAASLFQQATSRGDDLERTLPLLMSIAGNEAAATDAPKRALEQKMLNLYQTVDTIKVRFPESASEGQLYANAMLNLERAADSLDGPLDGKALIEAASRFKKARTDYEEQLSELQPTFFQAIVSNFR
jgi:hypothetical protein